MTLEEQIKILEHNAEHERQEQDLQGCLNFRQLAKWLKELKYYKDRQDLINKSWQELIRYKEGIEKIKMRIQAYRECGESILASGMEQALDILTEVNADED